MREELAVTVEEDEAFEALARRNDELQREKLDRLEELQHQEWQIDKLREILTLAATTLYMAGKNEIAEQCDYIIEQTKSEGE